MPDDTTDPIVTPDPPAPVGDVAPVPVVVAPVRKPAAANPKVKPARRKAAPAKATTKAVPAATDPAQAIALTCLHPAQYIEHMPFPGKAVTVEWVKARLVYRERLDEILASGAYAKTAACPTLPHDPLCGR